MKNQKFTFYRKGELNLKENFFKKGKGKQLVYTTEEGSFTYGRHKVNYFLKAKFGDPCHVDEYTCTHKKHYGCTAKIFERVKDGKKLGLFCLEGKHFCNMKREVKQEQPRIVNININRKDLNCYDYPMIPTQMITGTKRIKMENGVVVQRMIVQQPTIQRIEPRNMITSGKIIGHKRKFPSQSCYESEIDNYPVSEIKRIPNLNTIVEMQNQQNIVDNFGIEAIDGLELAGIYPEKGKAIGGDYIEVYFSVTLRDGIEFEQLNSLVLNPAFENLFFVQFDGKVCQKVFVKENFGNPQFQQINPKKYEKCRRAQFKMLLSTPAHKEGKVDVYLQLIPNRKYVVLRSGFEYYDHTKEELAKTNFRKETKNELGKDDDPYGETLFTESFFKKSAEDLSNTLGKDLFMSESIFDDPAFLSFDYAMLNRKNKIQKSDKNNNNTTKKDETLSFINFCVDNQITLSEE